MTRVIMVCLMGIFLLVDPVSSAEKGPEDFAKKVFPTLEDTSTLWNLDSVTVWMRHIRKRCGSDGMILAEKVLDGEISDPGAYAWCSILSGIDMAHATQDDPLGMLSAYYAPKEGGLIVSQSISKSITNFIVDRVAKLFGKTIGKKVDKAIRNCEIPQGLFWKILSAVPWVGDLLTPCVVG